MLKEIKEEKKTFSGTMKNSSDQNKQPFERLHEQSPLQMSIKWLELLLFELLHELEEFQEIQVLFYFFYCNEIVKTSLLFL